MLKRSELGSLEYYLAQIARELRDLPPQARADEMREIESHLRALIEARGDVAAVLAQFGRPRKVGRALRRAWEHGQPEAWWRAGLSPICALAFQIFAVFLFIAGTGMVQEYQWDVQIQRAFPQTLFGFSVWGFAYLFFLLVCFSSYCLISGLVMGAISPKRSKWIIVAYFLPVLAALSSESFGRGVSAYDNASGDAYSVIWSLMGTHILSTFLCFYGSQLGARLSRRRAAKIADAN